MTSEFVQVITVVQTFTYQGKVPSVKDLRKVFPQMHYNRIRARLDRGVKEGMIVARYHPGHKCTYYAYEPIARTWKLPWYRRLWNWLKRRWKDD